MNDAGNDARSYLLLSKATIVRKGIGMALGFISDQPKWTVT
jgi:hypothetical protein